MLTLVGSCPSEKSEVDPRDFCSARDLWTDLQSRSSDHHWLLAAPWSWLSGPSRRSSLLLNSQGSLRQTESII